MPGARVPRELAQTAWDAKRHQALLSQLSPPRDDRSRFVWLADLLADDVADGVAAMMEQGLGVINQKLQQRAH